MKIYQRKFLLIAAGIGLRVLSFAQPNLVNNGSFENGTSGYPNNSNQIPYSTSWSSYHTPDWFGPNYQADYTTGPLQPFPLPNILTAQDGNKLAGFGDCEGVKMELNDSLTDCDYTLSFWFSPRASGSEWRDGEINVYISPAELMPPANCTTQISPSQYDLRVTKAVPRATYTSGNWYFFSTVIHPGSGWKWILIRGYDGYVPDSYDNMSKAYQYIDNISLTENSSPNPHYVRIENTVYSGGNTYNKAACKELYSGYSVGNPSPDGNVTSLDANVNYKAGESIFLMDGFSAHPTASYTFDASIQEYCRCIINGDTAIANAGPDMNICSSPVTPATIGTDCSGQTYLWTASPGSAISWLSSTTSCNPVVTPPTGYTGSATFTVYVDNGNGIISSDDVVINVMADGGCDWLKKSIGMETENKSMIYPNPTTGEFTLQLPADSRENSYFSVKIMNPEGKIVYDQTKPSNSKIIIQLGNFGKGLYLILITSADHIEKQRIIVN